MQKIALSHVSQITKVSNAAVSAGTAVNGSAVDMSGWDGVIFFTDIPTSNAGNFLKAQQGAVSDGSDAADLAGTRVNAGTDQMATVLDIHKPTGRYVRPVLIRAGANTAANPIWAIRYNGRKKGVTNAVATVLALTALQSPALGTP